MLADERPLFVILKEPGSSRRHFALASKLGQPSFDIFDPMISWIQKYFQHHFKMVFAVLLTVLIISFVFTIGAAPGISRGERRAADREFFGYNLEMARDQQKLIGDASLSVNLQMGFMGGIDNEQLQQYAFTRAASLHLADELHIPQTTDKEFEEAIPKMRMFMGPNGEFDIKVYNQFKENLAKKDSSLKGSDVRRVIGDDLRVEKVNKLIAGPGYVLPRDIKTQLERADTTWTLATATADYAAFKPEIKPTEAELAKYFESNAPRFQIPPQVVVSYVEFPRNDFVKDVKVTDAEVRAFYDANPSRFPKPADAQPADAKDTLKPNPDADFAAVRPQVQAALVMQRAQQRAVKAASDLALALFESKSRSNPAALQSFLTSKNINPKPLAPFTQEEGPAELARSRDIADEAFRLGADHLVSDAVNSPAGAAVLFWKELKPARTPALLEVREKVVAEYLENERRKKFVDLGKAAKTQIEARLKAGDNFEKAVASAAASTGLKMTAKTLAPFSLRTRPQDLDYSVFSALEQLNKGQVSDMVINPENGVLVYAVDKVLPDMSESNPRYAETREQLASITARMGASAYIAEMVEREMKRSEPKPQQ